MLQATCAPGFFGPNCALICPLNTFGDRCGGRCLPRCSVKDCHHVFGCLQNDTKPIPNVSPGKKSFDIV